VEISASSLIGEFIGHTGPKTIEQLEKGLGRVLFIDEAYHLSEGKFAKEAITELVNQTTKPKFAGKLIIILAGYDEEMNTLLKVNPGLNSRFADDIIFQHLNIEDCLKIFELKLKHGNIAIPSMRDPVVYEQLFGLVTRLSKIEGWANARDVATLAQSMIRAVYQNITEKVEELELSSDLALECAQTMLSGRKARLKTAPVDMETLTDRMQTLGGPRAAPVLGSNTSMNSNTAQRSEEPNRGQTTPVLPLGYAVDCRDSEVSDEVRIQLQADKQHAILQEQEREELRGEKREALRVAKSELEEAATAVRSLEGKKAANPAEASQLQLQILVAKNRKHETEKKRQETHAELQTHLHGVRKKRRRRQKPRKSSNN